MKRMYFTSIIHNSHFLSFESLVCLAEDIASLPLTNPLPLLAVQYTFFKPNTSNLIFFQFELNAIPFDW